MTTTRTLGEVRVGQIGERTILAWTDGPIAKVTALDAEGRSVGPIAELNEPRTNAQGLIVLATAGQAFVLYTHKYGANLAGCDLVARTIDSSGVPGEPVVLGGPVCSITESRYLATIRDGSLLSANVITYEGWGVHVVSWTPGAGVQALGNLHDEPMTGIGAVEATADGFVVAWNGEALDAPDAGAWASRRLDATGNPVGAAEPLRVGRYGRPAWSGDRFLAMRLVGGALQLHELPVSARGWRPVDAGARVTDGRLDRAGGRLWAVVEVAGGAHRVVPLSPDGTTAGTPWDLAGDLLAIDGRNGVAVATRGRTILVQPLTCGPGEGG